MRMTAMTTGDSRLILGVVFAPTPMHTPSSFSTEPPIPLEAVVVNAELEQRPARPPEFEAESQALVGLMKVLKESNERVLQELAETALRLCRADSAGISIAEREQ